jgi:hypothetical protein
MLDGFPYTVESSFDDTVSRILRLPNRIFWISKLKFKSFHISSESLFIKGVSFVKASQVALLFANRRGPTP